MTGGAGCDKNVSGLRCPGQSDIEYNTQMSLWCMAAAPLLVSTDIRNWTDTMKASLLNTELVCGCATNCAPLVFQMGSTGFVLIERRSRLIRTCWECQVSVQTSTLEWLLFVLPVQDADVFSHSVCFWLNVLPHVIWTSTGGLVGNWPCSAGADKCEIWARPLTADPKSPSVARYAAALYNAADDGPHNITMKWSVIPGAGWSADTAVLVRDVW